MPAEDIQTTHYIFSKATGFYVGEVLGSAAQIAQNADWEVRLAPPEPVVSTDPSDYPLTPAQFGWLLAKSGLEDDTETVLTAAKASDRDLYAELKFNLSQNAFRFEVTMGLVAQMIALGALADTPAVSEATIGDLWLLAKDK
ncbi:hypothetical protein [Parasedimentitalea psychrophila]|uniref:Uncharacterized protein n=1 Tax=Parasedimentitalea psychrophila TaxID=2997337 RepID=A0A9Y2P151_9RHOB|nr:hypothetical protein [Parasedimentitalea psychrophila]WIY23792.1 hypothetical protein QPJ95_14190 [Parasedimentitalea psychrophila]